MSYEILTHRLRGELQLILKGKGEHEGTNYLATELDLLVIPPDRLAAELDRRFLIAHHDRLSRAAAATRAATEELG